MQGDLGEWDCRGRFRFHSLLEFQLCDIMSSRLFLDIYDLFKMAFDYLWAVVDVF